MQPQQRNLSDFTSEVLFLTGLSKTTTNEDIRALLTDSCLEADFTQRKRSGKVFARYPSADAAAKVQKEIHQNVLDGVVMSCRFELGFDDNGKRIVPKRSHSTIVRRIGPRRGTKKEVVDSTRPAPSSDGACASYSRKSISVNGIEYPFPSGLYLSRMIHLLQQFPRDNPMVRLLSDVEGMGNKYAKEMSEVMAMVDAVERGVKLSCGRPCSSLKRPVRIFVVGDGTRPMCASALALTFASLSNFCFVSIDPLLRPVAGMNAHRVDQFVGKSQEYTIQARADATLDIVVACHSHAPLQEFWDRLTLHRDDSAADIAMEEESAGNRAAGVLGVVMGCCAEFSKLNETPICSYDDFEVYSPKRRVHIYSK